MSLDALETELRKGDVGTVVVTLGTTAIGAVDPLDESAGAARGTVSACMWMRAYGGYFRLIPDKLDEPARRAFEAISKADSIVIDPHKHGLQPYGCGCVLFRDPSVGRFYKHDSPYTYFTSKQLHLGEISLECSRAGASAVALWATQQLLPLVPGGEFARGLAHSRAAALNLDRRLRQDRTGRFQPLAAGAPELDIVVWKLKAETPEQSSDLAQKVFDACASRDLHLALVQLPLNWFEPSAGSEPESHAANGAGDGDLPALGVDEARARGVARPHLGEADRELRRGDGRVAREVRGKAEIGAGISCCSGKAPGCARRIRGGSENEREGHLPAGTNFESGMVRSFSMAFA
jgi:tyrosine decarboxylase / aspartate 1-decarboxylase